MSRLDVTAAKMIPPGVVKFRRRCPGKEGGGEKGKRRALESKGSSNLGCCWANLLCFSPDTKGSHQRLLAALTSEPEMFQWDPLVGVLNNSRDDLELAGFSLSWLARMLHCDVLLYEFSTKPSVHGGLG